MYQCQFCGKFISNDEGITCVDGSWVCDNDSCRTLDEENESHIKANGVIKMNVKEVAFLVSEAERAVLTLEVYQNVQIQEKGNTILEKVCNYIYDTLSDAQWIFRGACYFSSISLNTCGMLYVGNSSALSSMKPVAQIRKDGIRIVHPMNDDELMVLIRNWEKFKSEMHKSVLKSVEEKQKDINQRISRLAYVQQQCEEFSV